MPVDQNQASQMCLTGSRGRVPHTVSPQKLGYGRIAYVSTVKSRVVGMEFLSPRQAAKLLGVGHATVHRRCQQYDGFAQMVDGRWRIPAAHINRVLVGETAAQVGRNPSAREGNATGSNSDGAAAQALQGGANHARCQLVQSYFCLLAARHHADEISGPSNDRLLGALASKILDAMKALGLIETGGLRRAISEYEGPGEFHALTGIRALF
jgi:hypothetical protein